MNPALWGWAALAFVLSVCGAGAYGYFEGKGAGKAEIQLEWDKAKAEAAARKEADSQFAANLDTAVVSFLANLEKRYARSPIAKALEKRVVCPKSGAVGDVVLPAELVDGMFNRPTAVDTAASASR